MRAQQQYSSIVAVTLELFLILREPLLRLQLHQLLLLLLVLRVFAIDSDSSVSLLVSLLLASSYENSM